MKHYYLKTTLTVAKGPALLAKSTHSVEGLIKRGVTESQIAKLVKNEVLVEVDALSDDKQFPEVKRADGGNKEPQSYSPSELEPLTVPVLQAKYKEEVAKYPDINPGTMPKTKELLIDFLSVNYTGD